MIDLVVISRDESPLSPLVTSAIRRQSGSRIRVHRVFGTKRPTDANRWETIARARNKAKDCGNAPWLMLLDDDVVMDDSCVGRLQHSLQHRPEYAALAADYLGQCTRRGQSQHVSMGATLFRRNSLLRHRFRWEPQKCECLCCCEDLRRTGMRIDYLPSARAWHLSRKSQSSKKQARDIDVDIDPALVEKSKILVAFNRRDFSRFRTAFLRTLRASGNQQEVVVVAYGLYPSEIRLLSSQPRVTVIPRLVNGQMPPVRRLDDFAQLTSHLYPDVPVAYWDVSDVLFQDRLDSLWMQTRANPGKLLAVREPRGYPYNAAIVGWTRSITDAAKRRRTFELFATHPFLNSGFAAGSAEVMHRYFAEASRLRSQDLRGTTDWGDQSAMNLYCHSDSSRWQEISEGWNYCLHDRPRGEVHALADGRIVCRRGTPVHVVHGNARSLAKLAIVR